MSATIVKTALGTVEKQSFLTLGNPTEMTSEQLADIAIEGVKKFRHYLPYVIALKERFDTGERDSTNRLRTPIKDCCSWKEFCETHLDRTPQAIGKALAEAAKPHAEKRKNRNEPVDDFEEVRAVAIKMLNIGLREMRKTEANHSLLDSAKTWALCKLTDRSESQEAA
jgi:hypothetical protein